MTLTDTNNSAVLEVVPMLDPIDSVDVTGISVARTQNYVDPDNVDTSNDEGVRQDRHKFSLQTAPWESFVVHLSSAHTNHRWLFQCKVKCAFAIK
jgi:hypothetical protein